MARQTNRRCIELVETLLGDQGDQLSADATGLHALFNDHHPVGLGDGALDGLHVEGLEADQIDQFRVIALLHQLLHSRLAVVTHAGVGEQGDVLALPHHLGFVEGEGVLPFRQFFAEVVEEHVLKKEHRVVVANGRLHQPLGVGGGAASHDLDPRHSVEVGLQALAVLGSELTAHTTRTAHHGGDGEVAAAGVAQHPHVVGDLVEGQQQKAHVHAFHDRAQPCHGGTNSHAREAVFSNRGIEHAQLAVFLVEILGDLVGAAVMADVLPHHTNVSIAGHLFIDGFTQGIE